MFKRIFDLMVCVALAIPGALLMVIAAILLRRDGPGPILFKQVRVGQNESLFTLYKLRTMRVGTADKASHEVDANQITRAGRILRRTKLDEIPQLWNVFKGEMSLVGPRPSLPSQHELLDARRLHGVYAIKPGITGLAQIQNVDMSNPTKLAEIDGKYVSTRSTMGDVAILFATISGSGRGDAVSN